MGKENQKFRQRRLWMFLFDGQEKCIKLKRNQKAVRPRRETLKRKKILNLKQNLPIKKMKRRTIRKTLKRKRRTRNLKTLKRTERRRILKRKKNLNQKKTKISLKLYNSWLNTYHGTITMQITTLTMFTPKSFC